MYFSKIFVVLAAVSAASAMTTHFGRRDFHHHRRAVVAREPELVTETPVQVVPRPRKRANGRCKASSSAAPAASSAAAANAGNDPPSFTSTAVEQTTAQQTTAAAPTEEPTTKASPTTHAPTTTHTTAASTPTSGSGSSGSSSGGSDGETHSGDGTFYATGLGSCGITNHDTDYIAAVSHILYDSFAVGANPNNNALCNKKATATYQGKSVTVTITDRCTGCAEFDLDFSPSAFSQLADQSVGRIHGMTWHFDD